jgi:hypothetical protein
MKVKKVVFTLNVDNYLPDLTEITLPYLKGWADKIEADFHVISERKFPDMPVTYEKFQIWDLAHGEFADRDWFIYLDLDALIHPDCADFTAALPKDTTCSHGTDFTPNRFRPDKYFLRDGRFFGKGNWCAIFSDWCLDYYHPLDDITLAEAVSNIFPTQDERNFGITAEHLIDDWLVSRNISRYGLKHGIIPKLMEHYNRAEGHLMHHYLFPPRWKCLWLLEALRVWNCITEAEENVRVSMLLVKWGMDPAQAQHIIDFVKIPQPQPNGQAAMLPENMWHQARWKQAIMWMGADWGRAV